MYQYVVGVNVNSVPGNTEAMLQGMSQNETTTHVRQQLLFLKLLSM